MIATTATAVPMGAQVYQEEVIERVPAALADDSAPWQVTRFVARSLRSPLPGSHRLPMGYLGRAGRRERQALGRLVYPRGGLLHRMDLRLPPRSGEIVTVHDTVAWRFPDEGTPIAALAEELRAAAAVVCVSEHTAHDVAEMFGVERREVVHLGVDDRFRSPRPLSPEERERFGIPAHYLLHAGGASLRKNLDGLADAWGLLHRSFPQLSLVLAGPPHARRDELFRGLPRALQVGRLPDEVVPRLMAGAEAMIVPSLYEGFGLPVLEAMAAGAPVVAARTSSLPEVAGGAAVLVEPDGASLAEGIRFVLDGSFPRERVIAAGRERAAAFTWERCAREHADIYRRIADG